MQKTFAIITGIAIIIEYYVYQAFKTLVKNKFIRVFYWVINVSVYVIFISQLPKITFGIRDNHNVQIVVSIFLIFVLPKFLVAFFLFLEDLFRIFKYLFSRFSKQETHFPERRKFLSLAGTVVAGIFVVMVIDGIIFGKYRHWIRKVKIKIKGLPESFKGYKIIQISDVHSGSFFHPEKLQHAINLINEQNADLILFTGDMINDYADEFKPFIKMFSGIKSKDGKFSVLGNHDYGMYVWWNSEEEKKQNILNLIEFQKQAGFEVLNNEHRIIEKNGEKLYIIGVENWGDLHVIYPKNGDLSKASSGIPKEAAKILMSHDPTHFDAIVKKHPANVQLTLSGHTHGMQFGVEYKNFRWSPAKFRYPKWADLYESEGKYLYVNRGFGVIGFPGRVGINPEITVFELS
jgi:predicted MPP superfamily phosphohydrolase